jgi:hypothetical protein
MEIAKNGDLGVVELSPRDVTSVTVGSGTHDECARRDARRSLGAAELVVDQPCPLCLDTTY